MIMHWKQGWSYTDHVTVHALIMWLIMYFQSDSPSSNESYFVEGLVITLCLAPLDLWPLYLADIFVNGPSWKTSLLPHFSVPSVSHLDETVIKIACESGRQAKICPGSALRLNLTSISRWRKRNWGNYSRAQISQRSWSSYWSGPNNKSDSWRNI